MRSLERGWLRVRSLLRGSAAVSCASFSSPWVFGVRSPGESGSLSRQQPPNPRGPARFTAVALNLAGACPWVLQVFRGHCLSSVAQVWGSFSLPCLKFSLFLWLIWSCDAECPLISTGVAPRIFWACLQVTSPPSPISFWSLPMARCFLAKPLWIRLLGHGTSPRAAGQTRLLPCQVLS